MTTKPRMWQIGGAIVVLLAAYIGWFALLRPVFADVSETHEETAATETKTQQVRQQTLKLAEQQKNLDAQVAALKRLQAKIPKDVNVPRLMRTIQAQARAESVELDSLQPGQITLFHVVKPTPTASDSANAAPDQTNTPAPEPSSSNLGQGVVPMDAGLAYVPLTVAGEGTYPAIHRLVARLEHQQRAFLVTALDIQRQTDAQSKEPLTFTMQARVFVLNGKNVQIPASLRDGGDS